LTQHLMLNKIINGDCLQVMKTMEENSVDSIVTDPPYELGFMGKSWDSTGIANNKEMWAEALRVLKPGGHLLSFGGTRTYHRMACAIEDAGFEVRDMVSWIYGSGFPKSLNIGKAVDKLQGNEREVVGKNPNHRLEENYRGSLKEMNQHTGDGSLTKGSSEYEGWGTALKPACEPCVLARKPLSEKTVALNILKWGTGGINIDGSRVEIPEDDKENYDFNNNGLSRMSRPEGDKFGQFDGGWKIDKTKRETPQGRFPANIIHDGSDEVLEVFPNTKSQGHWSKTKTTGFGEFGNGKSEYLGVGEKDKEGGSASRFFYCAKTSKSERNKGCEELEQKNNMRVNAPSGSEEEKISNKLGNNHPTVKPQALMKYLITLITPKGGTVLDPFAGSGSTLVAAKDLGFNYIGIELTPEYIPIIEARLNATTR